MVLWRFKSWIKVVLLVNFEIFWLQQKMRIRYLSHATDQKLYWWKKLSLSFSGLNSRIFCWHLYFQVITFMFNFGFAHFFVNQQPMNGKIRRTRFIRLCSPTMFKKTIFRYISDNFSEFYSLSKLSNSSSKIHVQ